MQVSKWVLSVLAILVSYKLFSVSTPDPSTYEMTPQEKGEFQPWFTGSLLSEAGHTVPPKHVNIEPYLFVTGYIGEYNNHWKSSSTQHATSVTSLLQFTYGLTKNIDLSLTPRLYSKFRNHASDTRIGDLPVSIGLQALTDKQNSWVPDLRMTIKAIFPTGHYQHLSPHKHGTDATGLGSYQGGIGINIQKLFHLDIKLLRFRCNLIYFTPSSVHVKGFNTYGGGYGTSGKVTPGQSFISNFSLEYTFTQHWIGALDLRYHLTSSTHFSGTKGVTLSGEQARMNTPCKQEISLAPAIEYAFNSHLGLIFGSWFTIAGKNSAQFVSGVIALNYYN